MSEALDRFRKRWTPEIDRRLAEILPSEETPPERLHRAMRYAVLSGGKRLRPLATLLAAEALRADPAAALEAGCAVELVHAYSLIHDDLPCMDDDDWRRGRPTVHRAFDEATAVLAGDALLTLAFGVVARAVADAPGRAVEVLAEAAGSLGMVGGQALDLEAEGAAPSAALARTIDEKKTAALFGAALRLGGLAAGGRPDEIDRLGEAGRLLGIAFQIVDDLLDRSQSAERMGKATGKDDRRGKATLPACVGEREAERLARQLTEEAIERLAELPNPGLIHDLARSMLRRSH